MAFMGRLESHFLGHPQTAEFAIHFPKRDAHATLRRFTEKGITDVIPQGHSATMTVPGSPLNSPVAKTTSWRSR